MVRSLSVLGENKEDLRRVVLIEKLEKLFSRLRDLHSGLCGEIKLADAINPLARDGVFEAFKLNGL